MKTVASTLHVARLNLIERQDEARPKRGPQVRAGDLELAADIRRLVDERPTYGHGRIASLLERERRSVCRQCALERIAASWPLCSCGRRRPAGR